MSLDYLYKPFQFFLITILGTWLSWFSVAYLSHRDGNKALQLILGIVGLCVPFIVSISMIYGSKSHELIRDFWERLFLFRLSSKSLILIFAVIPAAFFLSTAISLLFGKSATQFTFASQFNVMKGWSILGLVIALVLAPAVEELGWRGYGVDSLRSHFNLFYTSMLFAILWGLWHLPLFFIKGYYHHELWNLHIVYVINFFVSLFPAVILFNWIFYHSARSIPAVILVHAMINALAVLFQTEQLTKCIFTILLCLIAAFFI